VHLKQNVAAMGRDLAAAGMAGLSGTRGVDVAMIVEGAAAIVEKPR
jgi:hypothetical protein